jgi:glycosyltransferase involved in cell wall biosynthesis
MNILIVTNLYPLPWEPNRATFNKQQFDRLSQKHDVRILVPVAWREYLSYRKQIKHDKHSRVKYVCYWYTPKIFYRYFGMFMALSLLFGARKWINEKRVDFVFGSWAHPDGYAAQQIAKKLAKPYFLKVHGSDINILTEDIQRKAAIAKVCRHAKHVFTPSDALKRKVVGLGINESKVTRIYNGVDDTFFYPEKNSGEPEYFLFVGNLKQDKGVIDLLEAYAIYAAEGGKIPLKFVGAGEMRTAMAERIKQLGLVDSVTLLGAMPHADAASYIRKCACLILPSYHEGVPNVVLEAANCGVPVISTRVGGIPEVVDEGKTGLLIEAGDVQALAKALQQFESDVVWKQDEILAKGRQFSWEKNLDSLEQVFLNSVA